MADPHFAAALQVLHRHFGFVGFRPVQERVVRSVLARRDTLAILPTGAGKSVCFQVPAMVRPGLTVVISPLLALMEDQVEAARARGLPARALNSLLTPTQRTSVLEELATGAISLLYVAPERCAKLVGELAQANAHVSLLAIDEAHCIAEWGSDFRPAYLTLGRFRRAIGCPPTVALTGSATPDVRSTIARTLGLGATAGYDLHLASFDRRNLSFAVETVRSERERLERLLALLGVEDRVAIVYGATRNTVDALARILRERGFRAAAYHAGLTKEERGRVLVDFLADRLEVVTATCAFGMGIDKPNVRMVVHWTMPATPESYYQEAGRAGRDGAHARCIMLYRKGDSDLPRRELGVTFPEPKVVERAWGDPDALSRLPKHLAASVERLRRELKPERSKVRWEPVLARRRAALDRLEAVQRYATDKVCRRAALLRYFGERLVHCSGCDVCGVRVTGRALDHEARRRLAALRAALGGRRRPFGAGLLDPVTLTRLAALPPPDFEALAGVAGVGPVMADRLGVTILTALGVLAAVPSPDDGAQSALAMALREWRTQAAAAAGVARFRIAANAVLAAIAERRPTSLAELARVPGVGPRFLAKHGAAVLALVGAQPSEVDPEPQTQVGAAGDRCREEIVGPEATHLESHYQGLRTDGNPEGHDPVAGSTRSGPIPVVGVEALPS
jgi:ATP-dependent DNA helicase RecQ